MHIFLSECVCVRERASKRILLSIFETLNISSSDVFQQKFVESIKSFPFNLHNIPNAISQLIETIWMEKMKVTCQNSHHDGVRWESHFVHFFFSIFFFHFLYFFDSSVFQQIFSLMFEISWIDVASDIGDLFFSYNCILVSTGASTFQIFALSD